MINLMQRRSMGNEKHRKIVLHSGQENFFRTILNRYPGENILMRTFKEIWRYKHDMD